MIINHEGKKYEIENWKEFSNKLLNAIGFQIVPEIQKQIHRMNLMGNGQLFGSYMSSVQNGSLIIESDRDYAKYLEYGTFDYWDRYGKDRFPDPGYPTIPKKKELTPEQKKGMPKGMQPFAPIRRVMYNQNRMAKIITKAVRSASR